MVVPPAAAGTSRPSKKAKKAALAANPTYWPKGVGYGSDALPSVNIDMNEVSLFFFWTFLLNQLIVIIL